MGTSVPATHVVVLGDNPGDWFEYGWPAIRCTEGHHEPFPEFLMVIRFFIPRSSHKPGPS